MPSFARRSIVGVFMIPARTTKEERSQFCSRGFAEARGNGRAGFVAHLPPRWLQDDRQDLLNCGSLRHLGRCDIQRRSTRSLQQHRRRGAARRRHQSAPQGRTGSGQAQGRPRVHGPSARISSTCGFFFWPDLGVCDCRPRGVVSPSSLFSLRPPSTVCAQANRRGAAVAATRG